MEEVDGSNPPIDTKQLLLHIIGSVLGSDPGRAGSNPAGATIFIAAIVQRKEQSTSNP